MISYRSINNFISVNMFLIFVSSIHYYLENNLIFIICRNLTIIVIINFMLKNKNRLSNKQIHEKYNGEFIIDLLIASTIEYFTSYFVVNNIQIDMKEIPFEFIKFIPISFIFEIIFDLFHYLLHRLLHSNSYLYMIHKHHHEHCNITSIIAFHQNPLDLIMTNSIPFLISLNIISRLFLINKYQIYLINTYKIYIEICGHIGKESKTSSFPQFIWLPKFLEIELYSEDHFNHHLYVNCNYAKRFSLWDKIFETFYKNF